MAKYELKFLDCRNAFQNISTQVNSLNQISIVFSIGESFTQVCLDKSTAIKFSRKLQTEINKITESEEKNG